MSGSYDHTVKLWDKRQPDKFTTNFDHGCPVESICLLPNGSLLASAGGHEIRIWDLLAGKLLTAISPHNKTITSLGIASNGTRLVSASLDRQVFEYMNIESIWGGWTIIKKSERYIKGFKKYLQIYRSNFMKLQLIKRSIVSAFRLQYLPQQSHQMIV